MAYYGILSPSWYVTIDCATTRCLSFANFTFFCTVLALINREKTGLMHEKMIFKIKQLCTFQYLQVFMYIIHWFLKLPLLTSLVNCSIAGINYMKSALGKLLPIVWEHTLFSLHVIRPYTVTVPSLRRLNRKKLPLLGKLANLLQTFPCHFCLLCFVLSSLVQIHCRVKRTFWNTGKLWLKTC